MGYIVCKYKKTYVYIDIYVYTYEQPSAVYPSWLANSRDSWVLHIEVEVHRFSPLPGPSTMLSLRVLQSNVFHIVHVRHTLQRVWLIPGRKLGFSLCQDHGGTGRRQGVRNHVAFKPERVSRLVRMSAAQVAYNP